MRTKKANTAKRIEIVFLYLNNMVCGRCSETERRLDDAVAETRDGLEREGVNVAVRKIHVRSARDARRHGLVTSPTIRVNGSDVQPRIVESRCGDCGGLCGEASIGCRDWLYRGRRYTLPPKAMIVDAIRRASRTGTGTIRPPSVALPENLRTFFSAKRVDARGSNARGSTREQSEPACRHLPVRQAGAGERGWVAREPLSMRRAARKSTAKRPE